MRDSCWLQDLTGAASEEQRLQENILKIKAFNQKHPPMYHPIHSLPLHICVCVPTEPPVVGGTQGPTSQPALDRC